MKFSTGKTKAKVNAAPAGRHEMTIKTASLREAGGDRFVSLIFEIDGYSPTSIALMWDSDHVSKAGVCTTNQAVLAAILVAANGTDQASEVVDLEKELPKAIGAVILADLKYRNGFASISKVSA
ncbi:hypothetical protein [Falsiphaeobacter marinintestinus]|uniref:hypothetical protein n=1 Tax=Falsiphaeobacter marinintestinus TaxID=1492905 RepID=UPI0011B40B67|nr:hypothetical protein [Phaeobacter marinintestinus]